MPAYDTAIVNGTVAIPSVDAVRCNVGIRDGRVAALADPIASRALLRGRVVFDGKQIVGVPSGHYIKRPVAVQGGTV